MCKAALYTASDGRAEPQKAAPAVAARGAPGGRHVLTDCAVRGGRDREAAGCRPRSPRRGRIALQVGGPGGRGLVEACFSAISASGCRSSRCVPA